MDWETRLQRIHAELAGKASLPNEAGVLENLIRPVFEQAAAEFLEIAPVNCLTDAVVVSLHNALKARLVSLSQPAFRWFSKTFWMTPWVRARKANANQLFFPRGIEPETLRFLTTFPKLGRLWAIQVENWLEFCVEFIGHDALFAKQLNLTEEEKIVGIDADLSDLHGGGRTVFLVRFSDLSEWYYKPRSGENEKAWFGLLAWLNEEDFPLPFRVLKVISQKSYSWMEAAKAKASTSKAEVTAFYRRAGALLYLYHQLGGIDLHCDNLIASGEHPIVVDCETLFHEPFSEHKNEHSILRCGMLPAKQGTDRMSVSALSAETLGFHNVLLDGEIIQPGNFLDEIVAGFLEMHHFLTATEERVARFRQSVREMSLLQWRKIRRPTTEYHSYFREATSAEVLLGNAMNLERWTRDELRQLERGDIPIFHKTGWLREFPANESAIQESIELIRQAFRPS